MQVEAPPRKRRLALKTWHWMIILPVLALGFKVTTWAIAAGLDGRTVYHRHRGGPNWDHDVPFSTRFLMAMRGYTSTRDYPCPLNDTPVESEHTIWPR